MVNEYRTDIYKSAKISIGKVMRNPEILRLVLDHLKNLKKCVKELPYLSSCVPDQCKTQQICNKAILENGETFKSVPVCYKNKKMCHKAVDNHLSTAKYVPDPHRTEEMCYKAVNRYFLYLILVLINIKLNKCLT